MSPEQARGESVDQRSDLFSLGSVLYAMCTGRAPFRAETSYGVLRRVTDEEPRPIREINSDIPEWLSRVVAKLMSKQPDDRFASAREVAELLKDCLAHVQQPTTVPLPASLVPKTEDSRIVPVSRRKLGVIVMVASQSVLGLPGRSAGEAVRKLLSRQSQLTAGARAAENQPAAPQSKAREVTPRRLYHFAALTRGHSVKIAFSADGRLFAVANGNPTIIHDTSTKSRAADHCKPSADILDAETGKTVASLKLTTAGEDAVLAATERISHVEATALAFSPDGNLVAVGTSIGRGQALQRAERPARSVAGRPGGETRGQRDPGELEAAGASDRKRRVARVLARRQPTGSLRQFVC